MKDRIAKLIHIAELYYYDQMTQAEIAKKLGISRSAVSMALTEAREAGLVQVKIQSPDQNQKHIAASLVKKFRLKSCYVISLSKLDPAQAVCQVAQAAWQRLLPCWQKGNLVGISCEGLCFSFLHLPAKQNLAGALVSMTGNVFDRTEGLGFSDALLDFCGRCALEAHVLYTPHLTQCAADRLTYQRAENYVAVSQLWDRLDCALTAADDIGASPAAAGLHDPAQRLQYLMEHLDESAGTFCGRQINLAGIPLQNDYNHCVMGIAWEQLKKVPVVWLMAAGAQSAAAVLGGLNSGLVHHLILDEVLARQILELSIEYYPFREFLVPAHPSD